MTSTVPTRLDRLVNDFATRSFRDTGDGDYIAARLAFRFQLVPQFLWSSLQAIEKYLKCMLVLNRIMAERGHSLDEILKIFDKNKKFELGLSEDAKKFLVFLDTYGRHRYYETPYYIRGHELLLLDKTVWEIRRYARGMDYNIQSLSGEVVEMLEHEIATNVSAESKPPHSFYIIGGRLESIIEDRKHPSREPLLWQNAFYGKRVRKTVKLPGRGEAGNSPLWLHPEILDEVLKYVWMPDGIAKAYRDLERKRGAPT